MYNYYVDKDFETYVQRRSQLSHNCTSRSKMELIDTITRMKGQGSHELVDELKKERNDFEMSSSQVLDCFLNDLGLDRK